MLIDFISIDLRFAQIAFNHLCFFISQKRYFIIFFIFSYIIALRLDYHWVLNLILLKPIHSVFYALNLMNLMKFQLFALISTSRAFKIFQQEFRLRLRHRILKVARLCDFIIITLSVRRFQLQIVIIYYFCMIYQRSNVNPD